MTKPLSEKILAKYMNDAAYLLLLLSGYREVIDDLQTELNEKKQTAKQIKERLSFLFHGVVIGSIVETIENKHRRDSITGKWGDYLDKIRFQVERIEEGYADPSPKNKPYLHGRKIKKNGQPSGLVQWIGDEWELVNE